MRRLLKKSLVGAVALVLLESSAVVTCEPLSSAPAGWLQRQACKVERSSSPESEPGESCESLEAFVARARNSVSAVSQPEAHIDSLNRFFFQNERLQVTQDLSSSKHLLPSSVLEGRKGYCVGLALLYLVLAEELQLPIHGVATPRHVFLRWDDGRFRRNIELLERGRNVPDLDYIREQEIPDESLERGVFMANLTPKEFMGFVYQNLGVLDSHSGRYDRSSELYDRALHLNPKLAAAHYNLGNDFLKLEQFGKAMREYDKSLNLYPGDRWALQNRELARKGLEELRK